MSMLLVAASPQIPSLPGVGSTEENLTANPALLDSLQMPKTPGKGGSPAPLNVPASVHGHGPASATEGT